MLTVLDAMGLHDLDVQRAYDDACDLLVENNIDAWDLADEVLETLKGGNFSWDEPTDSIIEAIFICAESRLEDKYENINVRYDANGGGSWIMIDDEEYG